MLSLATSFVLGYHGCEKEVGEDLLRGVPFKISDNDHDWLGPGVYFWEANPQRGLDWAVERTERKKYKTPFVIGAVIDLGSCFDLMSQRCINALQVAYKSLEATHNADPSLGPLPENAGGEDKLRRRLDCAVVRRGDVPVDVEIGGQALLTLSL